MTSQTSQSRTRSNWLEKLPISSFPFPWLVSQLVPSRGACLKQGLREPQPGLYPLALWSMGAGGLLGQGVPPWDSYLPLNQQPQLPGTVNKTLPTGQGLAGDQEQECPGSSPGSRATSEGEVGLAALVSGPVFRKCEHLLRSPHLLPPLTPLGRVGYPGRQRAPFGPQAARMSLLRGSGSGGYQNQLLLTRPVWLGYNSWSPQWPQASTPALPQAVLRFYNPQYFFPDDKSRIGSLFKKKKKTGLK